jgi:hypothetical protein
MAVPIRTDTFSEGPVILFDREFGIPVTMRSFELYETS